MKEPRINTARLQCVDIETLSMIQFDRSVASLQALLETGGLDKVRRVIATGCGDSFLAAVAAKAAFEKYLQGMEYVTPSAIDAGRYCDLACKDGETLLIAVSVSGGAVRLQEILQRGQHHGCLTMALTDNLESRAAQHAQMIYHTNTPKGDNLAGIRTYYASMISLYIMAAMLADRRQGTNHLAQLKNDVLAYKDAVYAQFEKMDQVCRQTAQAWLDKEIFEVTADGPLLFTGRFISAKFVEIPGEACAIIDSENYFHVNSLMYPGSGIGEIALVFSHEPNVDCMVNAIGHQAGKAGRDVLVISDVEPSTLGIGSPVRHCQMPAPDQETMFLLPLFAFLPGTLLAGHLAQLKNLPYFLGGVHFEHMTLGDNPVKIL